MYTQAIEAAARTRSYIHPANTQIIAVKQLCTPRNSYKWVVVVVVVVAVVVVVVVVVPRRGYKNLVRLIWNCSQCFWWQKTINSKHEAASPMMKLLTRSLLLADWDKNDMEKNDGGLCYVFVRTSLTMAKSNSSTRRRRTMCYYSISISSLFSSYSSVSICPIFAYMHKGRSTFVDIGRYAELRKTFFWHIDSKWNVYFPWLLFEPSNTLDSIRR